MILPPYLRQLGYGDSPVLRKLDAVSFVEKDDHIVLIPPWSDLRSVFEYLACVEFARHQLLALPTGRALGSTDVIPARYHSASLVFFAQATLDTMAVWLNRLYDLGLRNTAVSFYAKQIGRLLQEKDTRFGKTLSDNKVFISRLNSYRMEWLHRLPGGAEIYSDKNPTEPDANATIQVPIDPTIPSLVNDSKRYRARIRQVQAQNKGNWLMPINDFANWIADGAAGLTVGLVDVSIANRMA